MGSKRTTYFADEIDEIVDVGPDGMESYSGRVGFLIAAAAKMAEEACPMLPVNVWCALADANNGTWHTYESGPAWVISGLTANLYDSDSSQFDVDNRAWALRIRDFPFAQQFAIFEVVRRFWTTKGSESSDYTEQFRRLGAKVEE